MHKFKPLRLFICLAAMLSGVAVYADTNDAGANIAWGYAGDKGPQYWAQLSPAFELCAKGNTQSPVNIGKRVAKTPATLSFHYENAPLIIVDDGLTDLTIEKTQVVIADGHSIQLNFPENKAKEAIMLDDNLYRLKQLHIHEPSEHELQGQSYPMEIHFVHQGNDGKVVMVSVMVLHGASNLALQKIIDHLPPDKGIEHSIEGVQLNPFNLIPRSREYYTYMGSLTVPPCSEGVEWVVMANAMTASSAQIARLRRAMDGDNARLVQPLKKRRIYFSKR